MSQASRGSRVVFVGNIPFDLTEEQLTEIFKEVGPVVNFRLLFDRETGRPKGYGFCEYYDAETAASAVRNLNEYDIGGRQLRVDYAAMDPHLDSSRQHHKQYHHPPKPRSQQQHHAPPPPVAKPQPQPSPAPQLQQQPPQPQPTPPSMGKTTSVDEISKVLASMNSQELFTLMTQMKQMSFERPNFTRDFLTANPQVAYALFQAMVMMNIVDPNIITRIMSNPVAPATTKAAPPPAATPVMGTSMAPPGGPPPVQQQQPPPPMAQPPAGADVGADVKEQQKALLMQVMQLTDEQINALAPEHREQIRQLKSQLMMAQPQQQ